MEGESKWMSEANGRRWSGRYAQKGIQINEWKSHPVRCSRTTGSEFWGYRGNDVF